MKLLSLSFLLFSLTAGAHPFRRHCIETEKTEVSSTNTFNCKVTVPPQLLSKKVSYPNLRGHWYDVQYWTGQITRETVTTIIFSNTIVNRCTGQTLDSFRTSEVSTSCQSTNIENPNLDSEISESFLLSPLTEDEVKSALRTQLKLCRETK